MSYENPPRRRACSNEKSNGYKRPSYGGDFKAGALRLIIEHGHPIFQVSQELRGSASALREWLIAAKLAAPGGSGVVGESQRGSEEVARLKREHRVGEKY
jgi:transposase-like protein